MIYLLCHFELAITFRVVSIHLSIHPSDLDDNTLLHVIRFLRLIHQEPVNARQSSRHILLILNVIIAEEPKQCVLLHVDALLEELPAHGCVQERAQRIAEDDLGADRPPEPSDVRRMSDQTVDSVGDQLVVVGLLELNDVIEIRVRRDDGQLAHHFASHAKCHSDYDHKSDFLDCWEEVHFDAKLQPTGNGSQCVMQRMVEHERINGQRLWIRPGNR